MWVESRQYSGRLVSVSSAQIFDEPVYNYTRDFPFIFEEMRLPISFKDDRGRAEEILLDAARLQLTVPFVADTHDVREIEDRMSRHILQELDKAGIGIASATCEIVVVPPLRIEDAR
ncbi:MAG: hypothetical protein DMF84_29610 [Acidobacteria bacterium]|nr:MAG: hypothetical protein DMF84_29610 [Acidobacteriota bacterium]